jgi:hypothetical protein
MTQRDALTFQSACAGALALAVVLGGCLVTEKVEYAVRNTPPAITSMSPSAITRIPERPPFVCGTQPGIELTLDVRDPDVDDEVNVRLRVNRGRLYYQGAAKTIPRSGDAQRSTTTWCVPATARAFPNACNLVEVLVSGEFEGEAFEPTTPGDLTTARLLVLARVSDEPGATADDCIPILAELDHQSAAAAQADAGP